MDALVDALWSDPSDVPGSRANARGTGHIWGPDYTKRFCQSNGLKLVIRSHQVPLDQIFGPKREVSLDVGVAVGVSSEIHI